jgi:peptidoglycan/xylan/chitin deacetylase (PgdA/CDA1 family)
VRHYVVPALLLLVLSGGTGGRHFTAEARDADRKNEVLMDPRTLGRHTRPQYAAIAFHDIVDRDNDDDNAVTAANLISFFEWLRANKWTAITLDDIELARSAKKPLPDHAILITFDDGYRSLYTRAYPLALAYKVPIVAALVGSWMQGPKRPGRQVGTDRIPGTDDLISWNEAREMAKSGLVEFASHSYDLHHSQSAGPEGVMEPAGVTRLFDAAGGYETEDAYRKRIRRDLEQSRALMEHELGRAPRAIVWPFGRYTQIGSQEALAAKYEFIVTMDSEPGFPEDLPVVPRLFPVRDPDLPTMVTTIVPELSGAVRLVSLNPGLLQPTDSAGFERALGAAIERVRGLGATAVVVDAAVRGAGGRLQAAWFPNRVLPVKADVLSRITWQMRTRAHVEVVVSLPFASVRRAAPDDESVLRLYADLGANALADALLIGPAPSLAAMTVDRSSSLMRWEVRRRRNEVKLSMLPPEGALALRAFDAFERERPGDRLFLLASSVEAAPSAIADLTLIEAPPLEKQFAQLVNRLSAANWFAPSLRYRFGVWLRSEQPPSASALSNDVRLFQRRGGIGFGWEPDDPIADEPRSEIAAPNVSAARFPLLRNR